MPRLKRCGHFVSDSQMKTVSVPWSKEHYHLRDGKVRWRGYEVKGADPRTFEPLNHIWARDAKRVYTQHSVNRLADRTTFDVLNYIFAKDKSRVFYLSGWVKEADAASFRVLDQGRILGSGLCEKHSDQDWAYRYKGYGKDNAHVFHYVLTIGKPSVVRGADPDTFEPAGRGYARDRNHVYYESNKVKACDPHAVVFWNDYFCGDAKNVYYLTEAIPGADRISFEVIGGMAAKDGQRVYLRSSVIADAKPATFRLVTDGCDFIGSDGTNVFFHGEKTSGVDAPTFEALGANYFRDKFQVAYHGGTAANPIASLRVIPEADAATFKVIDATGKAADAQSIYENGNRVGPRPPA